MKNNHKQTHCSVIMVLTVFECSKSLLMVKIGFKEHNWDEDLSTLMKWSPGIDCFDIQDQC